jgi:hypothetical protein
MSTEAHAQPWRLLSATKCNAWLMLTLFFRAQPANETVKPASAESAAQAAAPASLPEDVIPEEWNAKWEETPITYVSSLVMEGHDC